MWYSQQNCRKDSLWKNHCVHLNNQWTWLSFRSFYSQSQGWHQSPCSWRWSCRCCLSRSSLPSVLLICQTAKSSCVVIPLEETCPTHWCFRLRHSRQSHMFSQQTTDREIENVFQICCACADFHLSYRAIAKLFFVCGGWTDQSLTWRALRATLASWHAWIPKMSPVRCETVRVAAPYTGPGSVSMML